MGPLLQADLEALQQLSVDLRSHSDSINAVGAIDGVADAYRFLSGRVSACASGVADTARLLDAAERDFNAVLHGIQF
ncbi:hypothetical protein [Rhodococcus sp. IEGM 1379]|uniref:hypothetical protein n=1 Tax=Rhodococcus sp. IEGM 1379 TaxID=3047086 RepID=UPI0024B685B4|nr:hypothetical protein [Rhodococcus sp. IEGM 1379]MDI9916274.1 hypothetical protein [Rhodococcus sp. IEGM 1379]